MKNFSKFEDKRFRNLIYIAVLAIAIISIINVFSFFSVEKRLNNVTNQKTLKIIGSSKLKSKYSLLFSDVNILALSFLGEPNHLNNEKNRLYALLNKIIKETSHESIRSKADFFLKMLKSFIINCEKLNSNVKESQSIHDFVNKNLIKMEENIGNLLIETTLKGNDTKFLKQLMMIEVDLHGRLGKIERLYSEFIPLSYIKTNQKLYDLMQSDVDEYVLKLRTIPVSFPIISDLSQSIINKMKKYSEIINQARIIRNQTISNLLELNNIKKNLIDHLTSLEDETYKIQRELNSEIIKIIAISRAIALLLTIFLSLLLAFYMYHLIINLQDEISYREKTEEKLSNLIKNIPGMIYRAYPDWTCEIISNSKKICGHDTNIFNSSKLNWTNIIHGEDYDRVLSEVKHLVVNEQEKVQIYRIISKSGDIRWVEDHKKSFFSKDGDFKYIDGVIFDITDKKMVQIDKEDLENQLRQSQKMEVIGTLAGGIAHDFNNILAIISGNICFAQIKENISEEEKQEIYKEILSASKRGSDLVKSILTYSHKSEKKYSKIDVIPIFHETLNFLKKSIPATIKVTSNFYEEKLLVISNATEFQQVILNLCNNAIHAMGERGTLNIEVSPQNFDKNFNFGDCYLKGGDYLKLVVSDTGLGISSGIQKKIFDPYFTTKEVGVGTGMGLAVVQSIIKQQNGGIMVNSVVDQGTTFEILLPLIIEKKILRKTVIDDDLSLLNNLPRGTERILVVDDEIPITKLMKNILSDLGYTIVEVNDSLEALEIFKSNPSHFDLIITDMNMPDMNGKELSKEIINIRNDIKIILCTGYSNSINKDIAAKSGIKLLLLKPIDMKTFPLEIRKILDEE